MQEIATSGKALLAMTRLPINAIAMAAVTCHCELNKPIRIPPSLRASYASAAIPNMRKKSQKTGETFAVTSILSVIALISLVGIITTNKYKK